MERKSLSNSWEERARQLADATARDPGALAEFILVKFKKSKTRQLVASTLFLMAFIPFGAHGGRGPWLDGFFGFDIPRAAERGIGVASSLVLLATSIFTFANWRCPACRRFLGLGFGRDQKHCRKCGVRLRA